VGELLPELHEEGSENAPLVEIGVLSRARIRHPRDTLFLHDLASSGRTIHGDPFLLESLHQRLTGRRVARIEGKRLLGNRIAGLLYHLPGIGRDDPVEKVRVRDKLVRAREDLSTARKIAAVLPEGEGRLTTDEEEILAHARDVFVDREALAASLETTRILRDWKATLSCLHGAWESTRVPRGGRLGAGAALSRAQGECARVARAVLDGAGTTRARAEEVRAAVASWRRLLSGIDDTQGEDVEICASLLDRLG
jgi:hypothetical protein